MKNKNKKRKNKKKKQCDQHLSCFLRPFGQYSWNEIVAAVVLTSTTALVHVSSVSTVIYTTAGYHEHAKGEFIMCFCFWGGPHLHENSCL